MSKKKKRAYTKFIILGVLAAIMLLLSVLQFSMPKSENKFNGFIGAWDTSISYSGGTNVTYKVKNTGVKDSNTQKGVEAYSMFLPNVLYNKYYYNADVNGYFAGNGDYYVTLSLYDVYIDENSEIDDLGVIESVLKTKNNLEFKIENSDTAESLLNENHIKEVVGQFSKERGAYGVNIKFTEEGRQKFKDLTTKAASGSQYVYIFVAGELFNTISVSNTINEQEVFISGSVENLTQAKVFAAQFNSAKYDFEFTRQNVEVITKGEAVANIVLTAVIMTLIFALLVALLIVLFKNLGLVAAFSMLLATLVYILLLQAIPNIVVADISFAAMVIALIAGVLQTYIMLNNMKKGYAMGKKVPASVKYGFTKSYALMLDIFALLFVSGFIMFLINNPFIKSFGTVLMIGAVCYTFFAILINYVFAKWLVNISIKEPSKYGFKREANINELS